MKRALLFLAATPAIAVVLGIVAQLLGLDGFLAANGLNSSVVLGFAALMGFGGVFISLLIAMRKASTGAQAIDAPRNDTERRLIDSVDRRSQVAGIPPPAAGSGGRPRRAERH